MKKILTVLLIAVMAAGFVFAGVSGAAELDFGYNFKNKTFGFDASNSEVVFDFDLGDTAVATADGSVHAEASGKATILFANDVSDDDTAYNVVGKRTKLNKAGVGAVQVKTSWTAKIVGANWSVALKTADYGYCGFASSAIDTYRKGVKSVFGEKYVDFAKTAVALNGNWDNSDDNYGVEVTAFDYKLGFAFDGDRATSYTDFKAYVATPEYAVDGFTAQFAGSVAYDKAATEASTWTSPTTAIGLSAKFGYAADKFAGNVASDVEIDATESKADFDIAVAAAYDFVKFDGFYVNRLALDTVDKYGEVTEAGAVYENYMSAKLAFDFAKFDVPVTFKVTGKNLLAIFDSAKTTSTNSVKDKADFKFEVAYTGLINASAYFEVNTKDVYSLGFAASYDAAMFTVGAGFDYAYNLNKAENTGANSKKVWSADHANFMPTVYVTTDKLVPGAVLSLGWYSNTDNTKSNTSSVLTGSEDMGKITAKCVIAF